MNHHESDRFAEEPYRRDMDFRREPRQDMMGSLTDAVRENPVSAALIGMGALWLFMGGGSMPLFGGRGRHSVVGAVAHGAGSVMHGATDVAQGTAHAMSRMGSSVASGVSSTVGGFAESVGDAAGRMGEYVSGAVSGTDAQSEYRNPSFSDSSSQHGGLRTPFASMKDMFERHPIALGVAGLALGAGIAASLPVTSRERETLGRANEAVRSKLGEATEQVKDMASAMADEVRQQTAGHGPG